MRSPTVLAVSAALAVSLVLLSRITFGLPEETKAAPPQAPPPAKAEAPPKVEPAKVMETLKIDPSKSAPATAAKPPANNPKAIEIVNKYLDALGGLKVLEGIEDRTQKFRNTKHASTGDTVAALNQYLKKGFKVREEWDIEGVKIKDAPLAFTQVYNGSEGWVQMFGTVSPLEGRTLSLFVWDKYLDDQFCHWEEDGYTLDYIGPGTVDNQDCEIIEVTDFSVTKKERYFFSKQNFLLLKKEWKEQGQNGLTKREIFYKKYRGIPFGDNSGRNLQFALLQEVYEEGDIDTTREYTEVKINSGLKDNLFDRPEGEEFKGAAGQPPPAFRKKEEKAAAPIPAPSGPTPDTPRPHPEGGGPEGPSDPRSASAGA